MPNTKKLVGIKSFKNFKKEIFYLTKEDPKSSDLVNAINDSSGLGGQRISWFSILDSEQQGLSAHGLKKVLSLIVRPPQQREV